MGVCLAVTKVIGTTTLGIYTVIIASNISNYDILIHVLQSTSVENFQEFNSRLYQQLKTNGIILGALGSISSLVFQLSFFKAPLRARHPYLIYASLVLPISTIIYGLVSKNELIRYFNLKKLISDFKVNVSCGKNKAVTANAINKTSGNVKKEDVVSELDNSIYQNLGSDHDDSSSNETPDSAQDEDDEINKEVEVHLNKTSTENLLKKLNFANKIVGGVSLLGFVVASVGIYGDF